MEEGLQGLLMGAVLVMFLIAMESALQAVDSSEALEQFLPGLRKTQWLLSSHLRLP